MSAWQTNESAPRDGSKFIAWCPQAGLLFTMHFDGNRGFVTDYERWSGHFTHWMPRPEPPEGL